LDAPIVTEPLELWRSWNFDGTYLCSMNGTIWAPRVPMRAECDGRSQLTRRQSELEEMLDQLNQLDDDDS
jgi:hypothetical protein